MISVIVIISLKTQFLNTKPARFRSAADIEHYIGEMHFMRAWIYFSYLRKFGDYPIITEVLPDDKAVLMEKSVRQPVTW